MYLKSSRAKWIIKEITKWSLSMKRIFVLTVLLLLFSIPSFAETTLDANLYVNESSIIKPSSKNLLGINDAWKTSMMYFGNYTDTEISDKYKNCVFSNAIPINQMRMAGADAHEFNWKDSLGPVEKRANGNNLGLVEWIKANKTLNPNVSLTFTLNIVEDSIDDHCDLVRFLTLLPTDNNAVDNKGFNWAQYRVDLGIKDPVKITTFELGNEVYGHYVQGCGDKQICTDENVLAGVNEYVEDCKKIITAMKTVNPEISFAASDFSYGSATSGNAHTWNSVLVSELSPYIDYVVHHEYFYNYNFYWFTQQLEGRLFRYLNEIDESIRPKVYLSEYGYWLTGRGTSALYEGTSLFGTLTDAKFLNIVMNMPYITMANIHTTYEAISTANYWFSGWDLFRIYQDGTMYATGPTEMLKIFDYVIGNGSSNENIVSISLNGNPHVVNVYQYYDHENTSVDLLTVSAHTTSEGGLNLLFVNCAENISQNVNFHSNKKYRLAETAVLTAENMTANNIEGSPDAMYMKKFFYDNKDEFTSCHIPAKCIYAVKLIPLEEDITVKQDNIKILNSFNIQNGTVCVHEKFGVQCALYENSDPAKVYTASIIIPNSGYDVDDVIDSPLDNTDKILYFKNTEIKRNTAYFDITLPESLLSGLYKVIVYFDAKNYYTTDILFYPENEDPNESLKINVIENAFECYTINVSISYDDAVNDAGMIFITVYNTNTFEIVSFGYIHYGTKNYSFTLPRDTIDGKYKISANFKGNTIATSLFNFDKGETVSLVSTPSNSQSDPVTFDNIDKTDTITVKLKNNSETSKSFRILLSAYNRYSSLIGIYVSDEYSIDSSETNDYTIPAVSAENADHITVMVWDSKSATPFMNVYRIK